jgi:epoxyqueuosine reductase QueG
MPSPTTLGIGMDQRSDLETLRFDLETLRPDLESLRGALAPAGLNAIGVADGAGWQDALPGCQSVVVIGSGGPALFAAFQRWLASDPVRLRDAAHPLDDFVAAHLSAIDPAGWGGTADRRWAPCAADGPPVDFRRLAVDAGLGWLSRTGLLLHPEHGLWLGLRAALFTTARLATTGPLPGPGPCGACRAPCLDACPGGAMVRDPTPGNPSAWDWQRCRDFRGDQPCRARCDVRNACPEGAASRYPDLAQRYHNDHAGTGRAALAQTLGVAPGAGRDPGWREDHTP